MKPDEISTQTLKHILNHLPEALRCEKCGEIRPQLHIEEYVVIEYTNKIRVKVSCYRRRHWITTRILKLNEVRFVEEARPWQPKKEGGD